jgi:hypothetical protein
MKVGDLVRLASDAPRIGQLTSTGIILKRVSDDDPRYWAWRVFFGDRVLAYHESFLEVINEGR